jgi:hypothetical protein
VAGGAAPSDFSNNPHHNWLQDKVSSYAPATSGLPSYPSMDGPWDNFAQHMTDNWTDFLAALTRLKDAIVGTVQNPSSFPTMGVANLIDSVRLLLDALLDLCAALVDAVAGMAWSVMGAMESALNTELPLGFLNKIWAWIAGLAGHPEDSKLTLCALGSLAAAFPVTLIYKLTNGVDQEPFPDGKFPSTPPAVGAVQGIGIDMPYGCRLASDITRMVQVIPSMIADFLGHVSPWWLTAIGVIFSVAVWVLKNGYPVVSEMVWISGAFISTNLLVIVPVAYFCVRGYAWFKSEMRADVIDVVLSARCRR